MGSIIPKIYSTSTDFPARTQDWEISRCIVMEPTTDAQRTAPMAGPKFASAMDAYIKRMSPDAPARSRGTHPPNSERGIPNSDF